MTKSLKKLTIATFAGVFLLSFGLTLVMDVHSVYGLGANYFDDDGGNPDTCDVYDRNVENIACGSSEMLLMVGETQYVRQTGGVLRLYFKNRRGQITILNHHWCPNNSFGDLIETEDNDQGVGGGEAVTRIVIPGEPDVFGRRYSAGSARCDDKVQVSFAASQLNDGTGVGLPGLWYADITLRHLDAATGYDGIQNAMQLQLSSGSGFSYDPSNDRMIAPLGKRHAQDAGFDIRGHGITVEQKSGPSNYGLKVRFGTDCDITSPIDTAIWFYDLDGVGVSGGAQQNGNIKLQLRRINPNTGRDQWLRNGTTNTWDDAGPNADNTKTAPTVANDDWRWDFRAHPYYKYELRVLNIYSNNTIQMSPPFDGVYGVIECDYPDVRLEPAHRWSVSGHLEPGETAVYISRLNNPSVNKDGFVEDAHGRVWLDGGNKQFDGGGVNGDRVLEINDDYINGRTAVQPGGLRLSSDRQFTADAGYSYLCGQLFNIDASPPPPVETIILALPNPTCIPIGKYPALITKGGDARTGGAVSSSLTVCQLSQIPDFTDLESLGVKAHRYEDSAGSPYKGSYSGLAAISPGEIREFGSRGLFYNGEGSPSSLGLFGTESWKTSYPSEGYFLGQAAGAATPTHCLPDVRTLYPAPTASTAIDSTNTPLVRSMTSATASRTYVFQGDNKTLRLTGGALASGQRVTIRVSQQSAVAVNNTVVIDDDVTYPAGPYNSIAELPQLVIVADDNIKVRFSENASVYSGLIATSGKLYTCDSYDDNTTAMTSGACQGRPLAINGVTIVGNRLHPYRTSGFDTRADRSFAETFTLTPEFLLADYARAQQQNKLQVDYQIGLPPRF